MKVAVCIATYRRENELERLLHALEGLTFVQSPAPDLEIVVIDNDPHGSAAVVCGRMAARLRWPLYYEVEPQPGISPARNRAVAYAAPRADFLAFIDDDEAPDPGWIDALLHTQRRYDADVVAGPVVPRFASHVPQWALRGRFFERARHATGSLLPHAATNNALVRSTLLGEPHMRFDERLALSGGEDTHLFLRLARGGSTIVWADDAIAEEWVPEDRINMRWLLRRAFRVGTTFSFCERDLGASRATLVLRLVKSIGRIGIGSAMLPLSLVGGRHVAVAALRHVCQGAGYMAGLFGGSMQEYRTAEER